MISQKGVNFKYLCDDRYSVKFQVTMMITIKIRVFRIVIGFYVRLKKVHNLIFFTMILQNSHNNERD